MAPGHEAEGSSRHVPVERLSQGETREAAGVERASSMH